ncbi:ankyrin repeat domain-containing protein [Paenibacillus daejeonensis]|uniref:ankyrin repeat domain-containing protein n=1 Tax=Paenibacillus daejeonensis TaxID=135193 RepID=UPI0003810D3F|nr:ankyrin repeat domain-containing protein [Paenibacillus daejeonensis]
MSDELNPDWLLRNAAWEGELELVKQLVEKGLDINYSEPDSVHPYGDTPIMLAAGAGQEDVVKYLLERGADVTYHDLLGTRASIYAKVSGYPEIAEMIIEKEPEEFHDYAYVMKKLTAAGVPEHILETLGTENKRLEFEGNHNEYLIFRNVFEVTSFKVYGYEVYDLLLELDNYDANGVISWCPARQQFISIDEEHDWIFIVHDMTWEAFLADPAYFLDRILYMEYDEEEIDEDMEKF